MGTWRRHICIIACLVVEQPACTWWHWGWSREATNFKPLRWQRVVCMYVYVKYNCSSNSVSNKSITTFWIHINIYWYGWTFSAKTSGLIHTGQALNCWTPIPNSQSTGSWCATHRPSFRWTIKSQPFSSWDNNPHERNGRYSTLSMNQDGHFVGFVVVWVRVICSPGLSSSLRWSWISDPPASVFQVPRSQLCAIMLC